MHIAGFWVAAGFGLYFVSTGFLAIVKWMGVNLDSEDRMPKQYGRMTGLGKLEEIASHLLAFIVHLACTLCVAFV